MTDAADRWQTMDGQSQVVQNLVYDPVDGDWELEQQGVIEAVTGNLYLAVDELEQLEKDKLQDYFMDDFDVSSDPKYVGFQKKDGAYYITRYNIASPAVDYTAGASGYSAAWTNRAGESYTDFAGTF